MLPNNRINKGGKKCIVTQHEEVSRPVKEYRNTDLKHATNNKRASSIKMSQLTKMSETRKLQNKERNLIFFKAEVMGSKNFSHCCKWPQCQCSSRGIVIQSKAAKGNILKFGFVNADPSPIMQLFSKFCSQSRLLGEQHFNINAKPEVISKNYFHYVPLLQSCKSNKGFN